MRNVSQTNWINLTICRAKSRLGTYSFLRYCAKQILIFAMMSPKDMSLKKILVVPYFRVFVECFVSRCCDLISIVV